MAKPGSDGNAPVSAPQPLLLDADAGIEVGIIGGLQRVVSRSSEQQNPPLMLLLHGAGGGARSLAKLGQLLQTGGPLLIPDLNGYGDTQLQPDIANPHSAIAQHCLVIDALLEAYWQPEQPIVIIGHSMGGLLSLLTALSGKWPVSKVIAIEPVAFSVLESAAEKATQAEDLEKVLALDAALQGNGDPQQALAQFIAYWNGAAWAELPESMPAALLQQLERIAADTLAVAYDTTPAERYQHLDLPVLLIQGALTPPPAKAVIQRMQSLLPVVETEVVIGAGHMGPVQQPALYASLINDFLAG